MSVVKLRKRDRETLQELSSAVERLKGQTSNSEVVGLALALAKSKVDEFLKMTMKDVEGEPLLELLKRQARKGEKTDARRIEEYLYA